MLSAQKYTETTLPAGSLQNVAVDLKQRSAVRKIHLVDRKWTWTPDLWITSLCLRVNVVVSRGGFTGGGGGGSLGPPFFLALYSIIKASILGVEFERNLFPLDQVNFP